MASIALSPTTNPGVPQSTPLNGIHRASLVTEQESARALRIGRFLSDTVSGLAKGNDLHAAIDHILAGLARELGAIHVFLFRHDPTAHTIRLESSYIDGRFRSGPSGEEMPLWGAPFPDDITPAWKIMTEQRGLFIPDNTPVPAAEFAWPGAFEYAARFELSDMGHIVLFAGHVPVGSIGIGLRGGRKITPEDKQLIEEVANQAAVAIRMLDLVEEAKRTAMVIERERAANEQTAELTKANKAITDSLRRMATESNLSRMPGMILLEVCKHAGAEACCWLDYDPERHTLSLSLRSCQGNVSDQAGPDEPPLFRLPFAADITPAFDYLLATDELVELSVPELDGYVWPGVMQWHNDNGRTSMLAYAVKVGDQPIGVLGMGFRCSMDMTRSQRELIRALANHLALAVHLTRLSRKANSAAVLDERNRIAREIHDSLAQNFTGILMQLQAANRFSEKNPEIARSCVNRAESLARNGLKQARRSVMSLVQDEEHYQDIGLALRSLVETATADTGTRAVVSVSGDSRILHPLIAVNLLRVCQEALGNAQRYAHAESITVDLALASHLVRLEIKDDGIGFVEAEVARAGFGLTSMRERAERINGQLTIESVPGQGTRIVLEAPLDDSREISH